MQGYIKGNMGPFITVHYNDQLEDSMQMYSKGTMGPFITVQYND
jgi:hypothetical protein